MYLQWSTKSLQDWHYFSRSIKAFFVFYLFLLIILQSITKAVFSETHLTNVALSTDVAIIFSLLFFGSQTFEEFKLSLIQILVKFLSLLVIISVVSILITAIIFTIFYSEFSIHNLISASLPLLSLLLAFLLAIILIFRVLPFISFYFILKIIKLCVFQSSKQKSNQFGHFLRYISWPSLLLSIIHIFLFF